MIQYYTYLLIDSISGQPFYVGKGSGTRMYQHLKAARREGHNKRSVHCKIISILNQGGTILYEKTICVDEQQAFNEEKRLISQHGRKDNKTGILCNLTDGGEGSTNQCRQSIERRAAQHRGMKRSNESKQLMSLTQRQLRKDGMITSNETKEKMRNDLKRKQNHPTEVTAKRRATAKKTPVIQYTSDNVLVAEWESLSAAAASLNTTPTNILVVCKGMHKTHRGFIWRKKDEETPRAPRWVLQFLLNGYTLLQKYKTTKAAELSTGCNYTSIIKCCNGVTFTAGGFIWKYGDCVVPELNILQLHADSGDVIGRFATIGDAAKSINIHVSQISNCINNRPNYSTAGGFKWARVASG